MKPDHQKPKPLFATARRAPCPVCGHVSYSPSGVHPQCAMNAADHKQHLRVKAKQAAEAKATTSKLACYEKQCPKCRRTLHVRKQLCDCGYTFPTRAARAVVD